MAKTINEMAMDAYLQGLYANSHDWKEGYEAGAKAVLQEIEKSLDLCEPPYLISVEQAYYRTEKLIKELKG